MHRCFTYFAAASAVCVGPAARSADWYTGAVVPAERDAWIVAVDASTTLSSQGSQFAGATVTAAPQDSLLVSGPRVRLDGLIGSYRAEGGNGRNALGEQAEIAAMAGYAWVMPEAVLSGFVGLNVRRNELSQFDGSLPTDSVRVGLKTALDYYARPTAFTMLHATGTYSTAFGAYYGRVRAGVASVAGGFLGPEFAVLGDAYYRQWRAGIHLSGMQLGAVQLGLSAGYLHDHARKGGAYTTLDLRTGF
ncbi:cellulose biosynthesis protein BcsS [Methylobacterium sp. J-068]|uniref:cellulose biosynthesis protein BcsS n=1 Tax=Methylobacterium sp. J-068 TaxID=2836649 RepID=UPI001FB96635|nr:cellulose biosynthesis protein BcsS [Methylobacterium sp. J-068]MCJ2032792.1 cellulose biosynthesis protein BcsS [Methylobacterium sp. J-068]